MQQGNCRIKMEGKEIRERETGIYATPARSGLGYVAAMYIMDGTVVCLRSMQALLPAFLSVVRVRFFLQGFANLTGWMKKCWRMVLL